MTIVTATRGFVAVRRHPQLILYRSSSSRSTSRITSTLRPCYDLLDDSTSIKWVVPVRTRVLFVIKAVLTVTRFTFTGWLFLFAVLMAAGLLFTMVFFVRIPYAIDFPNSSDYPLCHVRILRVLVIWSFFLRT